MAEQIQPTDSALPVFWSLSHLGSETTSRSEPHIHHQDPPTLSLSLFDRTDEMDDSDYLGLGLGLGFHSQQQQQQDPSNGDWGGDEFFIGRRCSSCSGSGFGSGSESGSEFFRACPVGGDGLRILGFESDSDSDEQIVAIGDDSISNSQIQVQEEMSSPSLNLNLPLCWDCLRIDDDEDRRDLSEEFEWEEIDGRLEERDLINMNQELYQVEEEGDETVSNIDWEVLLTNLGNGEDAESYFDEGFFYTTSDYDEVTFAQFQEHHESSLKGSPPAARKVVESLQSIVFTKEDVEKNHSSIICAVCKDEFGVEEKALRLPCSHCYHEDCILPWLGMRNTCPLCRYELPTDNPEYESWKARRAGNVGGPEVMLVEDERVRLLWQINYLKRKLFEELHYHESFVAIEESVWLLVLWTMKAEVHI